MGKAPRRRCACCAERGFVTVGGGALSAQPRPSGPHLLTSSHSHGSGPTPEDGPSLLAPAAHRLRPHGRVRPPTVFDDAAQTEVEHGQLSPCVHGTRLIARRDIQRKEAMQCPFAYWPKSVYDCIFSHDGSWKSCW